ncbi:MAG: hypothetical protein AAGK05_17670 [Pseudomonadota bacterium]
MTSHKHAAMIKAKADNMDLVVFVKNSNTGDWFEVFGELPFNQQQDFFICLPKHKEACLHWLNGGVVQVRYEGESWKDIFNNENPTWHGVNYFMMRDSVDYRIKPRKEKRWICITDDLEIEDGTLYESYADADENSPGYKQIVEIEVEV